MKCSRADEDDLAAQANALSIRDGNSAVARVLGSAAGKHFIRAFSPHLHFTDARTITGEFLSGRTYKGLEPRYGMDAPAVVEDMTERGGIARGYGHDREAAGDANLDRASS